MMRRSQCERRDRPQGPRRAARRRTRGAPGCGARAFLRGKHFRVDGVTFLPRPSSSRASHGSSAHGHPRSRSTHAAMDGIIPTAMTAGRPASDARRDTRRRAFVRGAPATRVRHRVRGRSSVPPGEGAREGAPFAMRASWWIESVWGGSTPSALTAARRIRNAPRRAMTAATPEHATSSQGRSAAGELRVEQRPPMNLPSSAAVLPRLSAGGSPRATFARRRGQQERRRVPKRRPFVSLRPSRAAELPTIGAHAIGGSTSEASQSSIMSAGARSFASDEYRRHASRMQSTAADGRCWRVGCDMLEPRSATCSKI
jgi:hypothetical protein